MNRQGGERGPAAYVTLPAVASVAVALYLALAETVA